MNVPQELSKDETTNDASSTTKATDTPAGGFGLIERVLQPVEVQTIDIQQEDQPDRFITADELKENRLSKRGIVLPFQQIFLDMSLSERLSRDMPRFSRVVVT